MYNYPIPQPNPELPQGAVQMQPHVTVPGIRLRISVSPSRPFPVTVMQEHAWGGGCVKQTRIDSLSHLLAKEDGP